ncbi:MAG: alpha/beta hydrolase, partial [Chloroflexota bacterium]|nr:alpha/beta hydrolase [Chloroflexota bacterium]
MPQTLHEFGGAGAVMHLAVANGFPPETYTPLLAPLTAHYRVLSLPPRALWIPPPATDTVRSWRDLADDLLAGLRAHDLRDVIAVGHSFGAVASLVAAAQEPQRFRALILLDPTIFPPHMLFTIRLMQTFGLQSRMPLVNGALKRRARFDTLDEAFIYWRGKRLFSDWSDDALRLYTKSVLHPSADGKLVLRWSPQWEARYYQTILTTTWRSVSQLRGKVPVLTLRGERSDTFFPAAAERLQRLLPDMRYSEIAEHGHLFPHTAPDAT